MINILNTVKKMTWFSYGKSELDSEREEHIICNRELLSNAVQRGETRKTDLVQNVILAMSGKINMLLESKTLL